MNYINVYRSYLSRPAFCQERFSVSATRNFPTDLPEDHLPWIWDAVYNSAQKAVVITTIPKKNCLSNFTTVEKFLEAFPEYGEFYVSKYWCIQRCLEHACVNKHSYIDVQNIYTYILSQVILLWQCCDTVVHDTSSTFRQTGALGAYRGGDLSLLLFCHPDSRSN